MTKSILALATLCLSLLATALPVDAASQSPSAAGGRGEVAAALADRDGDGLSDGLQQRLAELPPNAPVEVVVTFSAPEPAAAARHAVGPFQLKRQFRLIDGFAATMTAAQARALAQAPGVIRVEEDFRVTTMLDAANADFGTAAARSAFAATGSGIGICVVDTGVDPGHEQLDAGKVVDFVDFVNGRTAAYDDHGHGTHVAAIAAGDGIGGAAAVRFQGVAPGAAIYGAKVLNSAGSGSESAVIAGIEWCADPARGSIGPGVQVISMSLGSGVASDGRDALSQAVNNAADLSGKVTVVAAGNSGDGPETVGSPGAAAQAVTVGAAAEWSAPATAPNHSDGIYPAPFSSRGPTADGRIKPDVMAPGVSITSAAAGTASGYATWSGTSMATPFVSGAVALALGLDRSLTPGQVKSLLMDTAEDRGSAGLDNDWGAGLLNGYAFVAEAQGTIPEPAAFAFPTATGQTGTVPRDGVKEFFFEIGEEDLGIPVAATVAIISGGEICLYGMPLICDLLGGWAWSPDYDAELIRVATNTVVSASSCPLSGECGSVGRQETLHFLPVAASDLGLYKVRIYQFPDDPGGLQEGSVALDLSTGPLANAGGGTANQPPLADAGPDQSLTDSDGNGSESVTLDGSGSSDPDGTLVSWVWKDGATQLATGVTPTVTLAVGAHTLTLTVTDDAGAIASDTVLVTVTAAPQSATAGVSSLVTGRYVTTGKGQNKITQFVATQNFAAGEEIVLQALVQVQDQTAATISGAVVNLAVAGPAGFTLALTSAPSNGDGIAEARWKTTAPVSTKKKVVPGTLPGTYTATTNGVTAVGYGWDGVPRSTPFQILSP